ncbi:GntR family transcriptional regulator [Amycolatopsis sp. CA-230715]|uniref:GntR family transcriptional regulator n=1 Tax=Amycolatopsis sp. CA-230715 TaxID=2745196 RepID=UPI001C03673C|nr:GntR family transcriptional regulator [Amycolatopsis sp. CA-230715]QWF80446.1 hypothetical protein HUW46_03868 [Amycolatopsis sp. CA-230715]
METGTAGLAPFERIAETVRRAIARGDLKPGDQLPTNRQFAAQHGVSVSTGVKALSLLQEAGWLVSRASIGVFVADSPPADDVPVTLGGLRQQVADLTAVVDKLQQRLTALETASTTRTAE